MQRAESVIEAMRDTFVFHLDMAETGSFDHPLASELRDVGPGAEGVESIFAVEPDGYSAFALNRMKVHGTLTGAGRIESLTARRWHEIDAALALSPLLGHAMRRVSDAVWAYYLSAEDLLFLTPSVPASSFSVRPSLYDKPFWRDALPENNPQRRTVVTSIYEDAAGQGLMATVSMPIWRNAEFRGIAAVDIGLHTLEAGVLEGISVGASRLVDEKGMLVASGTAVAPDTSADVPSRLLASGFTEFSDGNATYWSYPVQREELWLVHSISRGSLWMAAARLALPTWLMLGLMVVLVSLLLRLRRAVRETRLLARRDPLTGALNRRAFEAMAGPLLASCNRQTRPAMVMMLDADHFKRVNDQHGHAVGDQVLVGIAGIVSGAIRQADLFGRYGGEEFLVLAPFSSPADGMRLADRIRQLVHEARFGDADLHVTVSIGVAACAPAITLADALEDADAALYRAKEAGRNRVELAEPTLRGAADESAVPAETS